MRHLGGPADGSARGAQCAGVMAVYGPRTTMAIGLRLSEDDRGKSYVSVAFEVSLTDDGWTVTRKRLTLGDTGKRVFAPGNLRAGQERPVRAPPSRRAPAAGRLAEAHLAAGVRDAPELLADEQVHAAVHRGDGPGRQLRPHRGLWRLLQPILALAQGQTPAAVRVRADRDDRRVRGRHVDRREGRLASRRAHLLDH